MPKKLTKILKFSGKKKGDGDNNSISSKASIQGASEVSAIQIFSYTIKKDKDLPKLHRAAWQGSIIKVKELAKPSTVNVQDKRNRTPLHLACAQGDANIATHLLACKAKVNVCDVDGRTPLMKAVDSNQCDCAKVLLDANSDAASADNDGLTPLHIAAHRGTKDIAALLLERDARIDAIDKNGCSPLHYATLQGHNDFVSFLINEGADVNATDGKGHTPLMLAAAEGRIGILKILLQGKPNIELKDDNGCTATDHATHNNNNSIVQLIKDYESTTAQPSKRTGRSNSMLIEDPKLALSGGNFRGPAIDNTDDLNDTKTEDTSAKLDVASHNSWNSNDEEDSSQALSANKRGPSLLGALKLTNHKEHNLVQTAKGHSSASRQSAVSSEGNPLISRPILQSTSMPPTTSNRPQQQQQQKRQQQMSPTGKKVSVEDYQLDSFDDTDSDSEVENKPIPPVVNSTPNVVDKKLPGLSCSFDRPPFTLQFAASDEKEKKTQEADTKVSATAVTSIKPPLTMVDNPAPKETEGLATETVDVKKEDISSDFDSSPPLSVAEDNQFIKQFSSDSEEEEDDISPGAYVPSVGTGLTKQSHRNPLTGHPQQQQLATAEKEKDKILELAHSSFLEMEDTPRKTDSPTSDKAGKSSDMVDTGSPSHNLGTFSPITPLTDQVDTPSMFPSDARPTSKKKLENSGITDHAVGVTSPLSESNSSLNTDSVIRQAEEIEQSIEKGDQEVQGKTDLKSAASTGRKKSDKQQSEGSDWDSIIDEEEDDDTTSKSDSKDEGHNGLAALGTYGLPDPFATHSKRGSKPPSKPVDYFNMYGSDTSEADDVIEKMLSPEMTSGRPIKTNKSDGQALQGDSTFVNTIITGNSADIDHHSSPTSSTRKHDDVAVEDDKMEFVNPLLDDDNYQGATTEESESEWEKELKLKRDQKAVDQSSLVTSNQLAIPVVDQKQAPLVDDKQLSPIDNSSVSKVLTNQPSSQAHSEQLPLENNKATRSLKHDTSIQHNGVEDEHSSPLPSNEASSPLPLSPSAKDLEASKRYQQKQNELLLVLEGRRKQVENTGKDKASNNSPTNRPSTRVDDELAHIKRPSINELRSTWEGQQQTSSDVLPPPHNKNASRVELEPLKSSPRSLSEVDDSDHLLNKGNAVTDIASATEDHALLQQPLPGKTSAGSSEILFSEEEGEQEESDSLPENVNSHLESPHGATSQLAVKNLELEKLTGTAEQRQRSPLLPLEQSSNKSVEKQYKSPVIGAAEETKQEKQLQQEAGEDQDDNEDDHKEQSGDVLASYHSDQRTTPTDERITDHNGTQNHPTDDSDDVILNGSISLSSQHTTTDLSATHNIVSPVPFLSSSLPRPSVMTGYGRSTSSLLESSGVSALQESLRKTQRELERAQSAEAHAKTNKKRMEAQLKESYRKQSDLSKAKAQLEESKLDLEMVNRSVKYQLEQESMIRRNAESLVDQLKQQLSKLEQQLRKEKESHQKTTSQKKEVELDHRTLLLSTQQLQERLDDLQTRLQRERDSWKLQETLYNERLKVFQDLQEESSKNKEHQAQVLTQLEESDVMRQSLIEKHSTLQQQLAQVQIQLSKEQQQHEELQLQLTVELEAANSRLTTKSNSLVETEKALLQLQQQFDSSLTELQSKAEVLSTRLDEEVANKEQAEAELSTMRGQHEKANNELHATLKEKLLLEKEQHVKEQESLRQTSLLEKDLVSIQEKQQEVAEKLQSMEIKLSASENENKNLQSRLFEQANQINAIQREADHNQQLLAATEEKLKQENELRIKLESQLASSNDKSATHQSELVYLRAQLDMANRKITDKDTHNSEAQDKFSSILDNLKTDHQQARNSLEEKLQSLRDQLMVAKEETARSNVEKNSLSKEIINLKLELERYAQEKQTLEKVLEQTKEKSSTDKVSQVDLLNQIQVLNSKLVASENNYITSQKSCEDLEGQLAELQQQYDELQEELALAEQECTTINEEKLELEESVSTLAEELEKYQNDLNKKDEQIVQLSTQLKHLQDVRSGLEQTTTLLRGEIHELESQLTSMTIERDKAVTSAEESKGLWETEIKSRSQLGLKLMQLEKSHSDHAAVLDNEKRKARKALEMKKNVERKMESYQERNALLQEELMSMRNQLKAAKKKFKEIETSESTVKAELNKTEQLLQSETDSLRAQLLKASTELRTESLLRKETENGIASLQRECERSRSQLSVSKTELREKDKVHRQLEKANKKLKEELNTLKEEVLRKYTPISELEAYKIQVEDKAKRELQAKLEEVNNHLEHQSTVQAALEKLRSDTELQLQSRYEQTTEELKFQLKKALTEVEELKVQRNSKDAEARQYKELFEVESQRREKLSSKLEMAREHPDHLSAPPSSLEQRFHQNSLSTSLSRNFPAPSYSQPTTSVPLKSSTNDLLSSVRQELDKSIAKHLDSVSSSTTTRPQFKHRHRSQSAPRRDDARVTAIAQNYFV